MYKYLKLKQHPFHHLSRKSLIINLQLYNMFVKSENSETTI